MQIDQQRQGIKDLLRMILKYSEAATGGVL